MSDSARPEVLAFRELDHVVRRLTEELEAFRRRALTAETRLRELEGGALPSEALSARVTVLEAENAALRDRLAAAAGRTRQMIDRVRFLRQQAGRGGDR